MYYPTFNFVQLPLIQLFEMLRISLYMYKYLKFKKVWLDLFSIY